eukprot:GFUD01035538.1.p1 GENE.GFUD01035538.1~~GFUD01035538.1.p1  ORF type:complete len:653 (+),score=177.79 GFUD01035538.1:72-2030(+)
MRSWPAMYLLVTLQLFNLIKHNAGVAIGIDLGTTYSCVTVVKEGGRVEVIPNKYGNRITPSVVAFTKDGGRLIGDAAKNQMTMNPLNTVYDVKRLIGREWSDEVVQKEIQNLPFKVKGGKHRPLIQVETSLGNKTFSPEEVSAMVLEYMKTTAEEYLEQEVTDAVITVPAYFDDKQRQATKDAAKIAGLNVMRIINEPTAAAMAFGLENGDKELKTILVYDLGGGTFDVSILSLENGVYEVLSTNGDTRLGGVDFDMNLVDHWIKLFKEKDGRNIHYYAQAVQKLKREAEKAKRSLSSKKSVVVEIESLLPGKDFTTTLLRSTFEKLNMKLFQKTMDHISHALDDADLEKKDIDEIVLVGGSSKIPKIQALLKTYFNGRDINRSLNPDESIAVGAAIQINIMTGQQDFGDLVLLDVTPLTLGIETKGGLFTKIIRRNTAIPTIAEQDFSTTVDNQASVDVRVFQGERKLVKENKLLASFELTGIKPAPLGTPEIKVKFHVDKDGILTVTARDENSGNSGKIQVDKSNYHLSDNVIKKMIKDAKKFEEEDNKIKERIESRNDLESYVYTVRNQFSDWNDLAGKVTHEEKKTIESLVNEKIAWIEENDDAGVWEFRRQKNKLKDDIDLIMENILLKDELEDIKESWDSGRKEEL